VQTCALPISCAARIERKLNRMGGVEATVNYVTGRASVDYDAATVSVDEVAEVVRRLGYGAEVPAEPRDRPVPVPEGGGSPHSGSAPTGEPVASGVGVGGRPAVDPELVALRDRFRWSLVLGLPVVLMAMIPALQFDEWMWLSFALASPVALWAAWPFHRAAWVNARHGTTTMDTLISVGVLAAYGWSVYALFWGTAGIIGMTHEFTLRPTAGDAAGQIYLEVAAGVPMFILGGRYAEARAKRRAGTAIEALMELGAKDVSVLDEAGREHRVPVERLRVGDRFVV